MNEAGSIAATLARIPPGLARQIIVVDNGSTDDTAACARTVAAVEVVSEPRRGYGRACQAGLARLRPEIEAVAFLAADGADDPAALASMLTLAETQAAEFVLGARQLDGARNHFAPSQRFGNWLAVTLIRWLWAHRYADLGSLRLIRREALTRLELGDSTWGWNVEMQIKAIEHGLAVREIPVAYGRRTAGRSKISGTVVGSVRAGVKILGTIARLWWRLP